MEDEKSKEESPFFGLKKEKNSLEECLGKYVVLTPFSGGNTSLGKLAEITDKYFVLNPYKGIICSVEKGYEEGIIEENEFVPAYGTRVRVIKKEEFEDSVIVDRIKRKEEEKEKNE